MDLVVHYQCANYRGFSKYQSWVYFNSWEHPKAPGTYTARMDTGLKRWVEGPNLSWIRITLLALHTTIVEPCLRPKEVLYDWMKWESICCLPKGEWWIPNSADCLGTAMKLQKSPGVRRSMDYLLSPKLFKQPRTSHEDAIWIPENDCGLQRAIISQSLPHLFWCPALLL